MKDSPRAIIHVLNRIGYGPRPGQVEYIQQMGFVAYIEQQLHPEHIADDDFEQRLADLKALRVSARAFATDYYQPMDVARREFTTAQKISRDGAKAPYLRWHLLPIAAVTLPGQGKPVTVIQQASVTPEELRFQRENQEVFDQLQAQKLLRAVYSERQLEVVLTDFWFNHFNVDARKIEDRPVMVEYERDVIRPHVLGRFRDLLEATATSPAMLFYLDNWMSSAPSAPAAATRMAGKAPRPTPKPVPGTAAARPPNPPPGRGLNENYGRELLELHTLGVDGGYTQKDVLAVARAFTGWTMHNPHDGMGFYFNDKAHDKGEKIVLGHRLKAGRGIKDGEQVLDILVKHPSTARFISTKLVRRFVTDDPSNALVERAARTFRRTDGDLREVMRVILTSPEFLAAERTKVKSPFEYVASTLRASNAAISNPRAFVNTVNALGEPLYQCQPPTGYSDVSSIWLNTGTLVSRLAYAQRLATNGLNAAKVDSTTDPAMLVATLFGNEISTETRTALDSARQPPARMALILGSPEFQRR